MLCVGSTTILELGVLSEYRADCHLSYFHRFGNIGCCHQTELDTITVLLMKITHSMTRSKFARSFNFSITCHLSTPRPSSVLRQGKYLSSLCLSTPIEIDKESTVILRRVKYVQLPEVAEHKAPIMKRTKSLRLKVPPNDAGVRQR